MDDALKQIMYIKDETFNKLSFKKKLKSSSLAHAKDKCKHIVTKQYEIMKFGEHSVILFSKEEWLKKKRTLS